MTTKHHGIPPFSIAHLPRVVFGEETLAFAAREAAVFGAHALLITGRASLQGSPRWDTLMDAFQGAGMRVSHATVEGEPSPELVDDLVRAYHLKKIDVVVGVGGGSALDAAKAVAGLLVPGNSVMDHLEGVGKGVPYKGPALPFIAVPTTAGTGSEATKNAVLSRRGPDGFKKSFRDEQLVARVAIVDPTLLETCPKEALAANGMDAFTQLLESLTSSRANPITDALGWSGLEAFRDGFWAAYAGQGVAAREGRSRLAYASLLSGVNLAQTGLGVVHGLASPLGARFPIPHGVVCGSLVAEATDINIRALKTRDPANPALDKYAHAGRLLTRKPGFERDAALEALVATLRDWTDRLALPRLNAYGMGDADVSVIVARSGGNSMKTNPLPLTDDELTAILRRRL